MKRHDALTKALALAGTLALGATLLAPLLLGLRPTPVGIRFRLDWLMPAELFPLALIGGVLLVVAAVRAHRRKPLISWSAVSALAFFVALNAVPMLTGLASGAREPTGLPWFATLAALAAYVASLAVMVVGGIMLTMDVFGHKDADVPAAPTAVT